MMKKKLLKIKDGAGITGSYVIKEYEPGTKKLLWQSELIKNLVVSGDTYGKNLISRALMGSDWTTVYPLEIDSASIGTGTNAVTSSDTALQTPVLSGIIVTLAEVISPTQFILSFFIPNASLANGTYTEFGLFCNSRLFARSLITPSYVKGANRDTTIEYTITIN